ncbi:MAG: hypothetical protein JNM03_04565 [Sphingopyxis sp.]|uniref:hypothetical protein n=1 Tax=Sphingopyxis sp. TaxID=1908224 RepID=UPI001A617AF3|nr:hypothetical protein [Sphingopyxis sp.]MBL9069245.1 hypothetical protein [Sphingopyxis sp.]
MTYTEKKAWLMLVAMVLAYSLYFGLILAGHPAGSDRFAMLWLFGTIAATQAIVVIVGHIWLAIAARETAQARIDERDRAIAARGTRVAYYVLLTGTIIVGVIMPFSDPPMHIVNTALFAVVVAETIGLLVVVTSYRRGWHG